MKNQKLYHRLADKNQTSDWWTKIITGKILIFLIILLGLNSYFLLLNTNSAAAEEAGLKLSPSLLEITAVAPTTISAPVIIENLSDEPANLRLEIRQFNDNGESLGKIRYTDQGLPDFFKNITVVDGNIPKTDLVIGPRQKKNLNLQITLDADEETSDYYFSVIFTKHQDIVQKDDALGGLHAFTRVNLSVAMNVLLSIKTSNQASAINANNTVIEEFSASNFINKGPVEFTVKIQNKSSNYIKPKGSIYITNMFGQLIGKIDLPAQNVLAGTSRYIGLQDQQPIANKEQPKILWPETFLLGPYKAVIELETTVNEDPISQAIHFIAIPIKLLITITTIIILGAIVYHRARKKMSEK